MVQSTGSVGSVIIVNLWLKSRPATYTDVLLLLRLSFALRISTRSIRMDLSL
jgi:hypothetical protein